MRLFCGWDGGGSKTEVLCADENGIEVARQSFGSLNLNGASEDEVSCTIANAVRFMQSVAGLKNFCALVIGAAGVSNAHVSTFITEEVRRCGYAGKLLIVGDHEIALEGLIDGPGAVLISGTGSICIGKDDRSNRTRAGGYGHLIDDCGSGYAIGRDILAAIVRAHDGRGRKTCLTEMVLEHLHVSDVQGVITWLYNAHTDKKEVAALAPLLNHALAANDAVANKIASIAAQELSQLAIAVWQNLGLKQGQLALAGSIFDHFSFIREETCRIIHDFSPEIEILPPKRSACEGAVKLAMKISS